jgi:hypothetical protein
VDLARDFALPPVRKQELEQFEMRRREFRQLVAAENVIDGAKCAFAALLLVECLAGSRRINDA